MTTPVRHRLGYRLDGLRRLYGKLFNYREAKVIPPLATMVLTNHAVTANRVDYAITATHQINSTVTPGNSFTYDVDYGDGSGHGTASSGSRTYATGGTKTITATITDVLGGGHVVLVQTFSADAAPTNILLSSSSIAEDQASGSTVGTLSVTDADVGSPYVYTLVTGTGSTDNASFTIVGALLKTAISLNFESKASYDIRVQATDVNGVIFAKALTVTVTNVNEVPTNIALSAASFSHGVSPAATIGTLSTTDVDAGDTFTYTFDTGTGDTDNALFTIAGALLKVGASTPITGSYTVRIRSTDADGLHYSKAFAITSTNATPTDIALSGASFSHLATPGATIGNLSSTDADVGDTFTYTFDTGTGDTDNASFAIVGAALKIGLSTPSAGSYSVLIRATDGDGAFFAKAFELTST